MRRADWEHRTAGQVGGAPDPRSVAAGCSGQGHEYRGRVIDSSKLADRLRAVVAPKGATSGARLYDGSASPAGSGLSRISAAGPSSREPLEHVLCGSWRERASGRSFVVEHRVEP